MSGGWKDSRRSSELPSDWKKIRSRVLKRDDYSCQQRLPSGRLCLKVATEVDHMRSRNSHEVEDLQSLCSTCHRKKTQQEALEGRMKNKSRVSKSYRRKELPHPDEL